MRVRRSQGPDGIVTHVPVGIGSRQCRHLIGASKSKPKKCNVGHDGSTEKWNKQIVMKKTKQLKKVRKR